ncbi:hypothetical protein HYT84_00125, partial [Candidatus Micrarchaeota archaeon]|nr:hypothetical protein [Candidatus Micrarchaeota archaeon]
DSSTNLVIERFYNQSKFEEVPIEELKKNNIHIAKDFVIKTNAGMLVINDVKNDTATLEYLLKVNDSFEFNGLPHKIVDEKNNTFLIRIDAEEGKTYQSIDQNGAPTIMLIKEVTEDNIISEGNHPLAGKTLYFEVTVRNIN